MEIASLHLNNQRNAAHYQFQTDFNELVTRYTPKSLNIEDAYAVYKPRFLDEGVALNVITKSATTEQIEGADHDRDITFRGMSDEAHSKLKHYNPAVQEAAKRVVVILDSYGNLAPKPIDEESALLVSLIADLRTKAAADIATIGIDGWIPVLESQNNTVIALEASRNSEAANRSELKMKQVRVEVDAAYNAIVKRINALIVVNGEAPYAEFVKELNTRIDRAASAIAQSRAKKPKVEEKKEA